MSSATQQQLFPDLTGKEASLGLGVLAVFLFLLVLGYVVFECISKFAKPQSTVNLTRLTGAMSGTIIGAFLMCVVEALVYGSGVSRQPGPMSGRLVAAFVFESFLCYYLILVSAPLLTKSMIQQGVQKVSLFVLILCGLQLFAIITFFVLDAEMSQAVFSYILVASEGLTIIASLLYLSMFTRRLFVKLKIPRGNERLLAKCGIYVCCMVFMALGLSILNLLPFFADYTIMLLISSRAFLALTGIAVIYMKIVFNQGLVRRIAGKLVYSRSYASFGGDEFDALMAAEKPKMGNGTLV